MEEVLVNQLFEEILSLAEEEPSTIETYEHFKQFMEEMLPPDILNQLQVIHGEDEEDSENSNTFLQFIFEDRYGPDNTEEDDFTRDELATGVCNICERYVRLTRHHVYPREIHKALIKKGYDIALLNNTVNICRMCHSTVHKFFTNEELARSYYTVDLLLGNEKFLRYAKWAANQKSGGKRR